MRGCMLTPVQKLQKPFQRAVTRGPPTSTAYSFHSPPRNNNIAAAASSLVHTWESSWRCCWNPQNDVNTSRQESLIRLNNAKQYHAWSCTCNNSSHNHTGSEEHISTTSGEESSAPSQVQQEGEQEEEGVSDEPLPGARHGGEKFAMLMTCTVCETRSAKVVTKQAYYEGVVLARCPGCENLHLIADRMGWFEDGGVDVQQLLEREGRGDEFSQQTVGNEGGVLELTMEDWKALKSTDKTKFTNSDDQS